MKKYCIYTYLSLCCFTLALLLPVSCTKDHNTKADNQEIPLLLSPAVVTLEVSEINTRVHVIDASYSLTPIGIGITKTGKTPVDDAANIYSDGYFNFKGTYINSVPVGWDYTFVDNLPKRVIPLYPNRTADVYAYRPHDPAVTDMRKIPFNAAALTTFNPPTLIGTDYMVADPLLSIVPTSGQPIHKTLSFKHIMTSLSFNVYVSYVGSVTFSKFVLETVDGEAWIPIAGYYDATKPAGTANSITVENWASRVEIPTNSTQYGSATSNVGGTIVTFNCPEIPVSPGATNRKLRITVYLNSGNNMTEAYSGSYIIDLAGIANPPGNGLRTGYCTYLYIYVDNYIKFVNFEAPVTEVWGNKNIIIDI